MVEIGIPFDIFYSLNFKSNFLQGLGLCLGFLAVLFGCFSAGVAGQSVIVREAAPLFFAGLPMVS